MARAGNHGGVAVLRKEGIVGHLRFAHHVGDVTKIEPEAAVCRRPADDQPTVEIQFAHQLADIGIAPLVLGFGKARVRKPRVHALKFVFCYQHYLSALRSRFEVELSTNLYTLYS